MKPTGFAAIAAAALFAASCSHNAPSLSTCIDDGWTFTKDSSQVLDFKTISFGEPVTLPHTWNGKDGQDGGNDYYRGTCYYHRALSGSACTGESVWLEFEGANSSADVYFNGQKIAHHDGGYSTFRVEVTPYVQDQNDILVAVDNSANRSVYPQKADFTFYGGLYRDVNIINVPSAHFALDRNGSPAIRVTPSVNGTSATVLVEADVSGCSSQTITYTIRAGGRKVASTTAAAGQSVEMTIDKVHLWRGTKDPFLYTLEAKLSSGDYRSIRFGCRTFSIDPDRGFFLNGEHYPLHGVSRHQDRPGIGNALLPEHHREDMDLICEMGANTIRLAHYQHDQYFYDLCDERGMVVWAEIPYISEHLENGYDNTVSQMTELISQNYNHPSICFWGLSNEITMNGGSSEDLVGNHKALNDLVHSMDRTRPTTLAAVSICPQDDPTLSITDIVAWNHYFGWYGGTYDSYGPWCDAYHRSYPDKAFGISEYGCEALNWHNSRPSSGDYSEEYQAMYHEALIRQLFTRDYLWATHVWNMFDFAADSRAEGGENGMNHKGLVSFDRKYRKDSFYAYKAWLSDEPFVHICGKRYVDRVEDETNVTVYSNLPEVELFANGVSVGRIAAEDHFFYFRVPNLGETELVAKAGKYEDTSRIVKVGKMNPDYVLPEAGLVLNWFDLDMPDGYYSVMDTIGDLLANPQTSRIISPVLDAVAQSGQSGSAGLASSSAARQFMMGYTLKRMLSTIAAMSDGAITPESVIELNERLIKVKKD